MKRLLVFSLCIILAFSGFISCENLSLKSSEKRNVRSGPCDQVDLLIEIMEDVASICQEKKPSDFPRDHVELGLLEDEAEVEYRKYKERKMRKCENFSKLEKLMKRYPM